MRRAADGREGYWNHAESGSFGRGRRLLISAGACLLIAAAGWYRGTWIESVAMAAALVVSAWLSAQAMRWAFLAAALFEGGWLLTQGVLGTVSARDVLAWPIAAALLAIAILLPSMLGGGGSSLSGDRPPRGRGGSGGPEPAPTPAVPLPPRRTLTAGAEAEPDDEAGSS